MDQREELRRQLMITFQAELDDHLGTLNKDLLILEESARQEDGAARQEDGALAAELEPLLADLLRAAHSVKGAARAVEMPDIETIAHRLEDVLGALQRGELSVTPELCDVLFPALDGMEEAMAARLRGESLPADQRERLLDGLGVALRGEAQGSRGAGGDKERGGEGDKETPKEEEATVPPGPSVTPSPSHPATPSPQEETIHVTTDKLDALMAGMGELLVARMRTEQRLAELRAMQQRVTRWEKSWRQVRTHYRHLVRQNVSDPAAGPNALDTAYLQETRGAQDVALRPVSGLHPEGSGGAQSQRARDTAPLMDFLASNEEHLKALNAEMNDLLSRFASDHRRLGLVTDELQDGVRRVRMVPTATLFDIFPRMVRDLARERDREVTLQVEGADTEVDRQVLEIMKDPLTHLLRNAVDHGIEPPDQRDAAGKPRRGTIRLRAAQSGDTIVLEVSDDGAGIDTEAVQRVAVAGGLLTSQEAASLTDQETIQLIFRSGLSTLPEVTELSGRGVGMDVVRQNLERLNGLIEVDTASGQGTTFTLTLPLTMATTHVLLVEAAGQTVAVPTTTVERILRVDATDVGSVEGKPTLRVNGRPLPLIPLGQVLELPQADARPGPDDKVLVVVLGVVERRVAFRVDELQVTQEVVIKSLGRQLKRVRNVAGATILGTGQVVMVLNVADLMKSAQGIGVSAAPLPVKVQEMTRQRVLVVDDSITTRTLERNILENAGYQVLVAADGQEAWGLVQSEPLDIVVADIAMPHMNGFTLTEKVKGDEAYQELPVVLVTSLESPQDRIRGLEAGADAYIVKSTFDQLELLETIKRLIG